MIVAPLGGRSEDAVRVALLSHGWEGDLARSTADGAESLAFHLEQLAPDTLEALVHTGGRLGLEVVTGEGWAVLAGARARLSALARPWTSPAPLVELASQLGHLLPGEDVTLWPTPRGTIDLSSPAVLGILNVTPDSFSDGGTIPDTAAVLRRAETLLGAGATMLDVGGESTRPGAEPVSAETELDRVLPAIRELVRRFPAVLISVDTVKAAVADAALDAGAAVVNDVSGLRLDEGMAEVVASRQAGLILMHSRGTVADMASTAHAEYPGGVLAGVITELSSALGRARTLGVASERIVIDPGLGFGKTAAQNVEVLRGLAALRVLGRPILVGPSRKRFLGELTGRPVEERDGATAMACAMAWNAGARLFRVHDPAATRDALAIARALRPR